jgi:hypothetical protein
MAKPVLIRLVLKRRDHLIEEIFSGLPVTLKDGDESELFGGSSSGHGSGMSRDLDIRFPILEYSLHMSPRRLGEGNRFAL